MSPACPACQVPMRLVHWHDLDGFECRECRGHFIRAKHLERFLDEYGPDRFASLAAMARQAPPSSRALTCPGCGTRSFRVVRRGILEIDICGSCSSAYFDEGESTMYLRQSLLKRLGQEAVDMLSPDSGWGDLLGAFARNFFD